MLFWKKLLAGVGTEFKAIFGVVPLLRRSFWIAWGLCFLPALVGLCPGNWAVVAQIVVLFGLGLAGLFSGTLAKRVRRRKWVEFPDGPDVAPYLPQLITLLAGPPYFLAMFVLFHQAARAFPGMLPTAGWFDAILLSLDNFIRTQLFFDAAECFHLRFDGRVEGLAGASLVFVSRFLMDLVFIKLVVQLLNAAYFRSQGLGRGQDVLFTVKHEIEAADVPRVKDLCQQVGDSLRDAVDTLCRYHKEDGDKAAMAWRCLVTMKDYALPYLKSRHRAATGEERERIAKLINRLESTPVEDQKPPPTQPLLLIALTACLVLGLTMSFVLSGAVSLVVTVLMTALASWMLVGSRGWIDRLVRWHMLLPSTPDRLTRLQLRCALCLLPFLVAAWSRLFQLVASTAPEVFSAAALGEVNYPSTLVFVLENLLHVQLFVDTFEVSGVRIADIRQAGFLGGLLTFLLRLVLNLGIIVLLVSFGMVWFNRVFRKFPVSPNAELALRQEVSECGPQAAELVGYHLREVREFLVEQMKQQTDKAMLVALAASGFFKDFQVQPGANSDQPDVMAATRQNLGVALRNQGHLEEAITEYLAAREIYETLVSGGHHDFPNNLNLARTRVSLGLARVDQGRLEDAVIELQSAQEIFERLAIEGRDDLRYELAMTQLNLGFAFEEQGRLEESVVVSQAAREFYEQLVREGRDDLWSELALTLMNLGNALRQQSQIEKSVVETRAAREIYERLVREGRDDLRHDLAKTRTNLGLAILDQGQLDEAVTEHQAAREIYERLVREGRSDLRNDLACSRRELSGALWKQGRLDDAIAECQAAREVQEQLVREGREDLRQELAMTRMNLGFLLSTRRRFEEAITEYEAAREVQERLVADGHSLSENNLALTRMNLSVSLAGLLRFVEAESECSKAVEIYERLLREKRTKKQSEFSEEKCKVFLDTLAELLPHASSLSQNARTQILNFLRVAQQSNVCANEAAALAGHFASTSPAE